MGTRGAYGFVVNGKTKVSYNNYDSYPDGLGKGIVNFIACNKVDHLIKFAKSIKMVSSEKKPTISQMNKLQGLGIDVNEKSEWYDILRDIQGDLQEQYNKKILYMSNDEKFLKDSLFCEFAYIINFDDGVLEFYVGFNKNPVLTGRFADSKPDSNGYYPVILAKTYPLADLYACDYSLVISDMEAVYKNLAENR